MAEEQTRRLKQVATTLNIGTSTIVDYLSAKGFDVENKPTTKITAEQFSMLAKEFASSMQDKIEAHELNIGKKPQSNQVVSPQNKDLKALKKLKEEAVISQFSSVFVSADTIAEITDKYWLDYLSIIAAPAKNTYKLNRVASALNTSTSILLALLEKHGYYLDKKTNPKLSEEQLRFLADYFAVQLDVAIARSNFNLLELDNEPHLVEYIELADKSFVSKASDSRFIYLHFAAKEKSKKINLQDIKSRIHSILTPKLFHVFSVDEDSRVANQAFGFSTTRINQIREACSNYFSFKTRFFHETIATTY